MDSSRRNAGLFLVAATLTGGMYVATKAGLPYLPPVFFAALRFLVAAAILLPYVALRAEPLRPRQRADYLAILVSGGVIVAAANVLLFVGQQYTTSATAAIIISLSPILTVGLAAAILPSDRLGWRRGLGVLVGLVGMSIVARPAPSNLLSPTLVGEGLLFLAALAVAGGSVAMRRLDRSLSALAVTAWATPIGGCMMVTLSFVTGESIAAVSWTWVALLAIAYNGVIATPLGYIAYFTLLDTVGPVRVNLLTYVSPLITALFGWLLLGEQVSVPTGIGFTCIALGFGLLEYQTLTHETTKLRAVLWRR